MLKHVVFFKFKKDAREADIVEGVNGLKALPGIIAEIRLFECGLDVVHSERSFDFALVSAFDNLDAMQRYQVHPAHQAAAKKMRELSDSVFAVDFEL